MTQERGKRRLKEVAKCEGNEGGKAVPTRRLVLNLKLGLKIVKARMLMPFDMM